jgi:Na+-driven multidrug efflux pump
MGLSFLARWVFRIPVAIALAFSTIAIPGTALAVEGLDIGVMGVWLAFSIGATLTFIMAVLWFRRGNWTEGVIDEDDTDPAVESVGTGDELEEMSVEAGPQPEEDDD